VDLGVKVDGLPAEQVSDFARSTEQAGLDEFWVVEDLGLAGGIAQAATALATTTSIRVGLGISPAAVRNAAYFAMEVATLARIHPGRFLPGLGHGMPEWLEQVGAHPVSLMAALEEVTTSVGRLLLGEEVSFNGRHVHLDRVVLKHPPHEVPGLHLGVRGPKGMELAKRAAAGVILAEGSTPEYVRGVREAVGPGQRLTVFVWTSVGPDADKARDVLRPVVRKALSDDFMRFQLGDEPGEFEQVLDRVTVSGGPEAFAAQVEAFRDAGADALIFAPQPGNDAEQIAAIDDILATARKTSV
jgi:5,10-methylenetetrahydromethanopterin reductase